MKKKPIKQNFDEAEEVEVDEEDEIGGRRGRRKQKVDRTKLKTEVEFKNKYKIIDNNIFSKIERSSRNR